MKGSKKSSQNQEKRSHIQASASPTPTSKLKTSPGLKGRQSVKIKYGLDDGSELSRSQSQPFRKFSANSTAQGGVAPNKRSKSVKQNEPTQTQSVASGAIPKVRVASKSSAQSIISSSTVRDFLPRKGECEVCGQSCRSHCAGCKRVFYCSKQHQQHDWSKHKLICRPFSIPTQYSSGFHLRPPAVVSSLSVGNNSGSKSKIDTGASSPGKSFVGNLSPELQFMISTKSTTGGNIVFTEKPLLVLANVFGEFPNDKVHNVWCCSCLKILLDSNDKLNNNKIPPGKSATQHHCSKCDVILCTECYQQQGRSEDNNSLSKRFYGGQGHSSEECALISELRQKIPELNLHFKSGSPCNQNGNCESCAEFLKDLTILRILMFRTLCPWRWESLVALRTSPRYIACCKHNCGNVEEWMGSSTFPVSNYYLKNICKDKSIEVVDIVKIVGMFSEVSGKNPGLSVLYENRSWLAHACTPNTELFYRQDSPTDNSALGQMNLEIIVKAVGVIEEGSKITMNYLTNFEGGRSALAMRLFQSKGHYCCDANCVCYQRSFDKSLGIRCDLFSTTSGECHACSGILCPRLDAPNPEKANLGYGMFMKSKKWECDKCKKSEKYENLHKRIMEIAQDLTRACDRCCSCNSAGGFGKGQSFLQLQSKLLSNLSDQHWMVWKARMRVLKTWSESFGYGSEMLRSAISDTSCPERTNLMYVIKQKVDMYGEGIYSTEKAATVNTKTGILDLFAKRHGQLSPKRGHLLFDAFYANLIVLIEDYKRELPLPSRGALVKRNQIAQENCKKFTILRKLLEQTVESLKVAEGTTVGYSKGNRSCKARSLQIAKDTLVVISKVCTRVEQRPSLIISYLNDLLELYACQDTGFVLNCVRNSQPQSDPFRRGLDDLDFEVNSSGLGSLSFVFGVTIGGTSEGISKSSSNSNNTYNFSGVGGARGRDRFYTGTFSSSPFGFSSSTGGIPDFGISDVDSSDDNEDEDNENPFVYSRNSKAGKNNKNKNNKNSRKSKDSGGKSKTQHGNEDWTSSFWFSSDDDLLDDEFDIGFTSSPRSTFGAADLFNDQELEDLAEWAAIQFMMGKMKM